MKTKVIIQNGTTSIELTPENEFEKDVLVKAYEREKDYILNVQIHAEYNPYSHSSHENHKLNIDIIKDKQ